VLRVTFRDLQHTRTYIYRIRDIRGEIPSTTSSSADSFLPYVCDLACVSTSDPSVSSAQWRYRPGAALGVSLFLFLNTVLFIDVREGFRAWGSVVVKALRY
jgi:hypothetical protein